MRKTQTKTKVGRNGTTTTTTTMSVRLRPEIHEQLLLLKRETHIPVEHLVTKGLTLYFATPENSRILKAEGLKKRA